MGTDAFCSAINCMNSSTKTPDVSFCRFPKDPERTPSYAMCAVYTSNIQQSTVTSGLPSLMGDGSDQFVIRVRGLPYSASADEVINFLGPECSISKGVSAIHFTYKSDGGPRGEAYIELDDEASVEAALKKNKEYMSKRYVEVFRTKPGEMSYVLEKNGPVLSTNEAVLRLRGLPFRISKEEITQFFTGLEIVPNGITIQEDGAGYSTGDAFVQFASQDIADKACQKHKETIGNRYIEIFKSTLREAEKAMYGASDGFAGGMMRPRPSPYDRRDRYGGGAGYGGGGGGGGGRMSRMRGYDDGGQGRYNSYGGYTGYGGFSSRSSGRRGGGGGGRYGGPGGRGGGGRGGGGSIGSNHHSTTGHSVHMRGLPYQATEGDIRQFFSPVNCAVVTIEYQSNGRPSGEADVDFNSHDEACEAMKKDKSNMEHRYIELFLNSNSRGQGSGPPSLMSGGYGNGQGYASFGGDNFTEDYSF